MVLRSSAIGRISLVVASLGCQLFMIQECNSQIDDVRSIFLQSSGIPSDQSYARMMTTFPSLSNFTICYRIKLHRYREESTLMSYAISDSQDNEIRMDHRDTGFTVSMHSMWAKTDIISPLEMWTHYCVSYDTNKSQWVIYEHGMPKWFGEMNPYDGPIMGGGAYILGQEQDSLGGGFQRDQSFSGEISELNVWSKVLKDYEVEKISSCYLSGSEGDALAWSDIEWELHGEAEYKTYYREDMCETTYRYMIFIPEKFPLRDGKLACEILGGSLSVPQNMEENMLLYNMSVASAPYCSSGSSYLWLGANDIEEEGVWRSWDSNLPIRWEGPWRGGAPNGGNVENCLVMMYDQFPNKWSDIACLDTYSFCLPCEFNKLVIMTLKGPTMCFTTPFNTAYFIQGHKNNKPIFTGTYHSEIYWEEEESCWTLTSLKDRSAIMRLRSHNRKQLPIGRQEWTVYSDVCSFSNGDTVTLTLSSCKANEFTCNDGKCISIKNRCDITMHCLDRSDEMDCTLVDVPFGYIKSLPPPVGLSEKNVIIYFEMNVKSFPNIKTQDQAYQVTFELSLIWKDYRLNYVNLKNDSSLNILAPQYMRQIWVPRLFFTNAFGNIFTNLDAGARIECFPEGPSYHSEQDRAEETHIYKGTENSLRMTQLYMATYACDFDLQMFPFDMQTCAMYFTLVSASKTYMELVPIQAQYTGNQHLIEYTIGNMTFETSNDKEYSAVRLQVRLIRRYAFYLLTLYIPSVLLVIISYATLYFDPRDFNSRIVVALTTLLVLSSLFTQTSNSLPKTSYFKLVDIWLFFSTVIIFIIVIFHTMVEYYSYESLLPKKKTETPVFEKTKFTPANRVEKSSFYMIKNGVFCGLPLNVFYLLAGRVCIPLIYLIFNLCYWGISLKHLTENVWVQEV